MKKTVLLLTCAILVVMLSSCAKKDRESAMYFTIFGTIKDRANGEPIDVAYIKLEPIGTKTESDSNGYYEFPELDAAEYTVKVEKDGYRTYQQIVHVDVSSRVQVNVPLEKQKTGLTVLY